MAEGTEVVDRLCRCRHVDGLCGGGRRGGTCVREFLPKDSLNTPAEIIKSHLGTSVGGVHLLLFTKTTILIDTVVVAGPAVSGG